MHLFDPQSAKDCLEVGLDRLSRVLGLCGKLASGCKKFAVLYAVL